MPVVGLAVSGITGALFTSPGVPVIAGLADQLVAIALSAVGVDSSSDGPPPAAAVGHGAVGAYVTSSTTRVPWRSVSVSPSFARCPENVPPTKRLAGA